MRDDDAHARVAAACAQTSTSLDKEESDIPRALHEHINPRSTRYKYWPSNMALKEASKKHASDSSKKHQRST